MQEKTETETLQTWLGFQLGLRVAQAAWGTRHDSQQQLKVYPIVSQVARGELTLSESPSDLPLKDINGCDPQTFFHASIKQDQETASIIKKVVARLNGQ